MEYEIRFILGWLFVLYFFVFGVLNDIKSVVENVSFGFM